MSDHDQNAASAPRDMVVNYQSIEDPEPVKPQARSTRNAVIAFGALLLLGTIAAVLYFRLLQSTGTQEKPACYQEVFSRFSSAMEANKVLVLKQEVIGQDLVDTLKRNIDVTSLSVSAADLKMIPDRSVVRLTGTAAIFKLGTGEVTADFTCSEGKPLALELAVEKFKDESPRTVEQIFPDTDAKAVPSSYSKTVYTNIKLSVSSGPKGSSDSSLSFSGSAAIASVPGTDLLNNMFRDANQDTPDAKLSTVKINGMIRPNVELMATATECIKLFDGTTQVCDLSKSQPDATGKSTITARVKVESDAVNTMEFKASGTAKDDQVELTGEQDTGDKLKPPGTPDDTKVDPASLSLSYDAINTKDKFSGLLRTNMRFGTDYTEKECRALYPKPSSSESSASSSDESSSGGESSSEEESSSGDDDGSSSDEPSSGGDNPDDSDDSEPSDDDPSDDPYDDEPYDPNDPCRTGTTIKLDLSKQTKTPDPQFAIAVFPASSFHIEHFSGVSQGLRKYVHFEKLAFVFSNYDGWYVFANETEAPKPKVKVVKGMNVFSKFRLPILNETEHGNTTFELNGFIAKDGRWQLVASMDSFVISPEFKFENGSLQIQKTSPFITLAGALRIAPGTLGAPPQGEVVHASGAIGSDKIQFDADVTSNWSTPIGSRNFNLYRVAVSASKLLKWRYSTRTPSAYSARLSALLQFGDLVMNVTGQYPSFNGKCFSLGVSFPMYTFSLSNFLSASLGYNSTSVYGDRVEKQVFDQLLQTNISKPEFVYSPNCHNVSITALLTTQVFGEATVSFVLERPCLADGTCQPWTHHLLVKPGKGWIFKTSSLVPKDFPHIALESPNFILSSNNKKIRFNNENETIVFQATTGLNVYFRLNVSTLGVDWMLDPIWPGMKRVDFYGSFSKSAFKIKAIISKSVIQLSDNLNISAPAIVISNDPYLSMTCQFQTQFHSYHLDFDFVGILDPRQIVFNGTTTRNTSIALELDGVRLNVTRLFASFGMKKRKAPTPSLKGFQLPAPHRARPLGLASAKWRRPKGTQPYRVVSVTTTVDKAAQATALLAVADGDDKPATSGGSTSEASSEAGSSSSSSSTASESGASESSGGSQSGTPIDDSSDPSDAKHPDDPTDGSKDGEVKKVQKDTFDFWGMLGGSLVVGKQSHFNITLALINSDLSFTGELVEKPPLVLADLLETIAADVSHSAVKIPPAISFFNATFNSAKIECHMSPLSFHIDAGMTLFGKGNLASIIDVRKAKDPKYHTFDYAIGVGFGSSSVSFSDIIKDFHLLDSFPFEFGAAVGVSSMETSMSFPGLPETFAVQPGFNFFAAMELTERNKVFKFIRKWTGIHAIMIEGLVQATDQFELHALLHGDLRLLKTMDIYEAGFFIRVLGPNLGVGVEINFGLNITHRPDDHLLFHGDLYVSELGAGMTAAMTSDWKNPLGLTGVRLSRCIFTLQIDWELVPSMIGIGGGLHIGDFGGDFILRVMIDDPTKCLLFASLEEIHLKAIFDNLLGVVGMKLPNNFVSTALDMGFSQLSVQANMGLSEVTFDGHVFPPGFVFNALNVHFWGIFNGSARVEVYFNRGLRVFAQLQPLRFLNGNIVISGVKPQDPLLMDVKVLVNPIEFNVNIDGAIKLFDMYLATKVVFNDQMIKLYTNMSLVHNLFNFVLDCTSQGPVKAPTDFSLYASLDNRVQDWIKNELPSRISSSQKQVIDDLNRAEDAVREKLASLDDIRDRIDKYRRDDEDKLSSAQKKLIEAQNTLAAAEAKVNGLQGKIDDYHRKIKALKLSEKWKAVGYYTAIAALEVAKDTADLALDAARKVVGLAQKAVEKLPKVDPRILGLQAELGIRQAAYKDAIVLLEATKKLVNGIAFVANVLADVTGKAFNIQELTLSGSLSVLQTNFVASVHLRGVFGGKAVQFNCELNVLKIASLTDGIFKEIVHTFSK